MLHPKRSRRSRRARANRKHRQRQGQVELRTVGQCPKTVAAGGDERLHPGKLDGIGVLEVDLNERLDEHLVALPEQIGLELDAIGRRTCDQPSHQDVSWKTPGPARWSSSSPASSASTSAWIAEPWR